MSIPSRLRKVGGSVMVSIPPALLRTLDLKVEDPVDISANDGKLIIAPQKKPYYSLDELLASCDANASLPSDNSDWTGGASTGQELI